VALTPACSQVEPPEKSGTYVRFAPIATKFVRSPICREGPLADTLSLNTFTPNPIAGRYSTLMFAARIT
jgi:hypothetical protein